MKNKKMRKRIGIFLASALILQSGGAVWAMQTEQSVEQMETEIEIQQETTNNEKTIATQIEQIDELQEMEEIQKTVKVGFIFELPNEEGKEIFIQLGEEKNTLENLTVYGTVDGQNVEYSANEVIQNVAAFQVAENVELISATGIVDGQRFKAELKTLDESKGEVLPMKNENEADEYEMEPYVVTESLENEEAIAQAAVNAADSVETAVAANENKERSGQRVVVLDPGHAKGEAGTQCTYNGVTYYEHIITMKIARYMKTELEKSGVKVLLTRTEDTNKMSLEDRVKVAANNGAELLVSIHLNAVNGVSTPANGAEVMVAKIGTYRPDNAQEGRDLARAILDELVAIGFKDRGFVEKLSDRDTYPNGSAADYYGIVRNGQKYGVPAIIVEHGFLDNANDFNKYLSSDEKLQNVALADAKGILKYLGMSHQESDLRGWQTIDGKVYYYDNNGRPTIGTPIIDGKKYWFDGNGVQRTGWLYLTNWKMYFDPSSGAASVGMKDINGKRYLFNSDGVMQTYAGTPIINGKKYWFSTDDASLKTGWLNLGNWKMYFDPETYEAKTGFADIDGKKYLFNSDGVMQTYAGTPIINGKKYWFSTDSGSLKSGWLYLTNWKMYFDPETYEAKTGFADIDGKKYLFNSDGVMQTYAGTTEINGKKYWFSTDDASLKSGWLTLGNWKLYFDPETYAAVTGWVTIDGMRYYFDENGVLREGFVRKGDYQYYMYQDGSYAKGTPVINGEKYCFDGQGRQIFGWYNLLNWRFYFDPSDNGAAITTSKTIDGKTYYFNSDGTLREEVLSDYITAKDPENGKTYTMEPQFGTDPVLDDDKFLAATVYTESGNQSMECQIATALVMLNRQHSKSYPDTLRYVIYQKSQFEVARNGSLTKILKAYQNNDESQLKWLEKTEQAVAEAKKIMEAYKKNGTPRQISGVTMPNGKTDFNYLGFMTPEAFNRLNLDPVATEAFQIHDVMFYTKWVVKK